MLPRPHKLYVRQTVIPVGYNADGFELQPETEWVFWCDCRRQSCKQPYLRRGDNGESYECSSIVFVDCDTAVIEQGTRIRVFDGERVVLDGEVKEFDKGLYHTQVRV